jgi:hypothetical protein
MRKHMTVTTLKQWQRRPIARLFAPVMVASLAILMLSMWTGIVSAAQQGPALWPAYYNGTEVTIMMGPGDNSARPGAGTGPDVSKAHQPLSIMYALFIPDFTQMVDHDMVLTALPGDPGYNAKISVVACVPSTDYSSGPRVYTSEAEVLEGVSFDELECFNTPYVRFAQVVGGKSGKQQPWVAGTSRRRGDVSATAPNQSSRLRNARDTASARLCAPHLVRM